MLRARRGYSHVKRWSYTSRWTYFELNTNFSVMDSHVAFPDPTPFLRSSKKGVGSGIKRWMTSKCICKSWGLCNDYALYSSSTLPSYYRFYNENQENNYPLNDKKESTTMQCHATRERRLASAFNPLATARLE